MQIKRKLGKTNKMFTTYNLYILYRPTILNMYIDKKLGKYRKMFITIILVQIQQLQLCKLLVYYAELELYTALAKLINFHNQI